MKRRRLLVVNFESLGFWLTFALIFWLLWIGDDGRQAVIAWIGRGCA